MIKQSTFTEISDSLIKLKSVLIFLMKTGLFKPTICQMKYKIEDTKNKI